MTPSTSPPAPTILLHHLARRRSALTVPASGRPQESQLRVLQLLASPAWGGLEQAVVELANELTGRCVVDVVVPAEAEYLDRFSAAVEGVHALPAGSRRNPMAVSKLRKLVRGIRPDIVHAHAARAVEMAWWADRLPPGGLKPAVLIATKHNARVRRIFDRVPHVTGVSAGVAETIANPHGVTVVHNGLRTRPVPPRSTPDVFTMVAVGRLDRYKGFDRLLRAAADLPFPFRLQIVGEGGGRDELERIVSETGLAERVELLGFREDVPELLSGAHVQIVPSTSEGFSLALVEGLHYAPLAASTPVGIAPEILPEELLLDPDDLTGELRRVHADYDRLRELFTTTAATHHDRFTWSAAAEAYLTVYERALMTVPGSR